MKTNVTKWIFTFYLICFCHLLLAQQPDYLLKENNVWTFGQGPINAPNGSGLDFNTGSPPSVILASASGQGYAQASVCDTNGHLLFYTDGTFIFDANNNYMPYGDSLVGDTAFYYFEDPNIENWDPTASCNQGALIVGVPNNPNRYYVFSLSLVVAGIPDYPTPSNGFAGELFYSVVDMTLNNGLGAVIPAQRGVFLDSNLAESLVAVQGTHCDVWILVRAIDTSFVMAFNVNANGINTAPVISNTVIPNNAYIGDYNWEPGAIKVSPDRKKLAICSSVNGVELCDFDPASGTVSNPIFINDSFPVMQACFSPDNSKLYLGLFNDSGYCIYQYDLANNLQLSYIKVVGEYNTDLQLGPDGKIYLIHNTNTGESIDCISSPNLAGAACNYTPNAAGIYPESSVEFGLHNLYVKPLPNTISFSLGPDTAYCSLNSIVLNAPVPNASYLWQDGSTDSTFIVNNPGTYSVKVTQSGCVYMDTINIGLINMHQNLGNDTIICEGQQLTLSANVPPGASATWSTDSVTPAITVDTGTYWVTVTDGACIGSDTISIQSEICDCIPSLPNAFTPNRDEKNDVFRAIFRPGCSMNDYSLAVYNRWGQMVFNTADASQGWDGTFHGVPADVGTYMYMIQFLSGKGQQQLQREKGDVTLIR